MTMLNDTMGTAMDNAKDTMESAKKGTEHAASVAFSTLTNGIHAVTNVASLLRGLGMDDMLGLIGLARRRSPLGSLVLFGSGVLVGAGVGMLLAPMSGAELRTAFLDRFKGMEKDAKRTIKEGAKDIEQSAEKIAGKAKDAVVGAEHKVEDLAGKAKDAVVGAAKDAVAGAEDKVEEVAGKAKDTITGAERKAGEMAGKAKDALGSEPRKNNGVSNFTR